MLLGGICVSETDFSLLLQPYAGKAVDISRRAGILISEVPCAASQKQMQMRKYAQARARTRDVSMTDNIAFCKLWQEDDLMELQTVCSSAVITVTSKIYVSASAIDELMLQIAQFLEKGKEEAFWQSGERGNASAACLSLRFIRKDRQGHIAIEVFAELDDGGSRVEHNCCFFVGTEYGLLMNFSRNLVQLKEKPVGCAIRLNG